MSVYCECASGFISVFVAVLVLLNYATGAALNRFTGVELAQSLVD